MADSSERRQTEKVEAARLRAAATGRGEITRVMSLSDGNTETRSRWDFSLSVPTTPDSMIEDWTGTGYGGVVDVVDQQGDVVPVNPPGSEAPTAQESNDR